VTAGTSRLARWTSSRCDNAAVKRYEQAVDSVARRFGLQISRVNSAAMRLPIEATPADAELISSLRPFTMTSAERLWSLINAVSYVVDQKLPGDFAECGVWRGGSVMAMAKQLGRLGVTDRRIWLYDTFAGMTAPTDNDVEADTGVTAADMLSTTEIGDGNNVWCVAGIDDVRANVASTGYPMSSFEFVEGDVAQTLLTRVPDEISLLRLDTDWYESTKIGLEIMYPRLVVGGVCILDDYGHWVGARKAVDDYFAGQRPYMHQIDYSGRVFVKTR
jgi:O-methyltransferase